MVAPHLHKPLSNNIFCFIAMFAISITSPLVGSSISANAKAPSSPHHLLADQRYFAMENLHEAAALLLSDAQRNKIDIEAVPNYPHANVADSASTVIQLPAMAYSPDFSTQPFISHVESVGQVEGENEEFVAILVTKRPISIRETADLLKAGVRIFQPLVAGPLGTQFGGFIVKASGKALAALSGKPYFRWLGEYSAFLKQDSGNLVSPIGAYWVRPFYGEIRDGYLHELTLTGAEITHSSDTFGTISIKATYDVVEQIKGLAWVRLVFARDKSVVD